MGRQHETIEDDWIYKVHFLSTSHLKGRIISNTILTWSRAFLFFGGLPVRVKFSAQAMSVFSRHSLANVPKTMLA